MELNDLQNLRDSSQEVEQRKKWQKQIDTYFLPAKPKKERKKRKRRFEENGDYDDDTYAEMNYKDFI